MEALIACRHPPARGIPLILWQRAELEKAGALHLCRGIAVNDNVCAEALAFCKLIKNCADSGGTPGRGFQFALRREWARLCRGTPFCNTSPPLFRSCEKGVPFCFQQKVGGL